MTLILKGENKNNFMNKDEKKQQIILKRLEKNKSSKEELQKKLEKIEQVIIKDTEELEIISLKIKKKEIDKLYEVYTKSELSLDEFLDFIGGNDENEKN
ncbi:MAG: hypothetical protein MRZ16_02280 [Parvimonas sp.]|uniref:hypothetical protein n=1 Tax=Parvimonas sp. TaxID=1944660 RepID=UPI0025FC843C|nr:hypothetical protein [Parvimonas sp.]MCI5997047.1 hypothetical protein [Parvimonas sp.]